MKILVLGSGFLAEPIVESLESDGHELLVFSRTPNERIHCKQILGDIFDFEEFVKVLDWKPQIIIHTVWITKPGVYKNDDSNFKYSEFTTALAEYILQTEVEHLIILGTCAEYGLQSGPSTAGVTNLAPISLYANQKVVAFKSVNELLQSSDIRFTWARVFYPYGPNQDQKRLIPKLVRSLKNGEPVALDDISSIHDWITTRDIASAISWVINNKLPTEIDIGTSFGFTNLDLLETLEVLLQTTNKLPPWETHTLGHNEVFIAGKSSPLFTSGWLPKDSLIRGLEWILCT